jgi:hypothetical protein
MAVPIADDWKAIHDRMQQIRVEESGIQPPCSACKGIGWTSERFGDRRNVYRICAACQNPKGRPRPDG